MQNVDGVMESHGIYRAPSISALCDGNLEYSGATEPFEWLGDRIRLALLSGKERVSDVSGNLAGECAEIS